jgi:hypothetical protein
MKNKTKNRKKRRVHLAHFSMLYAVNPKQAIADANTVFTRNYDWITGTEAGQDPVKGALAAAAKKHGYTFHAYKSNWVAVRKDNIVKGSYREGTRTLVDNDQVAGKGHDPNVAWVRFRHPELGVIKVMCSHYPTKGRPDGKGIYRRNLKWTRALAKLIGKIARKIGKGPALVFYGGDQNIVDRRNDTFFKEPLTSAWDELNKYENTGHGNIDVIASFDYDEETKAVYIRALDDRELKMFSDHYAVEAGYDVTLRR